LSSIPEACYPKKGAVAPGAHDALDSVGVRCRRIRERLIENGVYRTEGGSTNDLWRIGAEPFWIGKEEMVFLEDLGGHLLSFYHGLNQLYFESLKGRAPAWVAGYLDQGKPDSILHYARMNRFKQDLPGVIRPDLLFTESGRAVATELDSVPGGIGLTGALGEAYSDAGFQVIGGAGGMGDGFAGMVRDHSGKGEPRLGIVISEESRDYRPEMAWLARVLDQKHFKSALLAPQEVGFTEEGLFVQREERSGPGEESIDLLYRFFELFDLPNVPKAELILYAAKKKKVVLTPPPKPQLEEKLALALFHHPALRSYWEKRLGEKSFEVLSGLFPETWVLDPREVPPHAVIAGLLLEGRPVRDFRELAHATQKERRFVVKPSGFSELAWGSRGVSVGHDLSEKEWAEAIERALQEFPKTPYVLQRFYKARQDRVAYFDFERSENCEMPGRTRFSPYYFVQGERAVLGGILATVCSLEKKLIHGMADAVMVPCAVRSA
jgi:hypothetical protein